MIAKQFLITGMIWAIIGGLMSIIGRFAGQVLNMTLGWATILLFGKVPQKKQFVLLIMVFGSLAWVALVIGVLVPDVGSILIAATPMTPFVDISWLRLAMLGASLTLPLVIGMAAVSVAESRPKGLGLVIAVLRGYPFAAVLALLMVVLAVVGVVRKLRSLSRKWEDAHVPVAHGRALAAAAPRARYLELPGEDHLSLPMRLDRLAPTVEDWFARTPDPGNGACPHCCWT